MTDTDREKVMREARRTLVEKSIQFADWAAGEGIHPAGDGDLDPAWFIGQYYDLTDGGDFGAIARHMGEIVFHSDTDRAPTPPADARAELERENRKLKNDITRRWKVADVMLQHVDGDVWAGVEMSLRQEHTAITLSPDMAEKLVKQAQASEVERDGLAARVAALEEALRPFAAVADQIEQDLGNVEDSRGLCVEMRHLRRARARLQPEEKGRETMLSCGEWAVQTFGRASISRALQRAEEELAEAKQADHGTVIEEIADVVICLAAAAHAVGGDLQSAIDAKMAVNRARKWEVRGDGTGYHIREASAQPEEEGR